MIYINGRFLTQKITGVQRYAIEILKAIDKLNTKEEIVVLHPKNIINDVELKNIKLCQIGSKVGHAWEQISLPIYILKHNRNAKLLNLCNLAPILIPGYVVIHDISFKTHSEHLNKKFSLWYRFVTRLNIKRYKHIFTVSESSKKEITENYKLDKEKVTVTYNSAEHIRNIKPDYKIIKKLGLNDNGFYFSIGSKSPHKNRKFIEECAYNNKDKIFVVSGINNEKVFNDKEEINCKNMIFAGYLTDEEIVALYEKCAAFLFPSLYEGFGIPPLEAIECGCKAIILSNIEVLKEIYKENGNYINPNNYKTFPKELKYITKENREEILKKYSWSKSAIKLMKILNNN